MSNIGVALVEAGNAAEGLAILKKSVAEYPELPLSYANLGVALYRTGDLRAAREIWTRGMEIVPIPDLHADLGDLEARGDGAELAEGIAHLETAVAVVPGNAQWRLDLGDALVRAGRLDEAQAQYAASLKIDPRMGRAHNNWGLLLAQRDRPLEAAAHYRAALEVPGARVEANYNWGNLYLAAGRWEEADRHYREALRLSPELVAARVNLGNALVRRGRLREAEAAYLAALKKDPRLKEAGVNLAAVRRALKRD